MIGVGQNITQIREIAKGQERVADDVSLLIDLNPKSTIHDPEFFNGKEHRSINPDEAVEHIAAVQDAIQQVKAFHKYRTCCYRT